MFKLIGKFILNGVALWVMGTFFHEAPFSSMTTLAIGAGVLALINVLF